MCFTQPIFPLANHIHTKFNTLQQMYHSVHMTQLKDCAPAVNSVAAAAPHSRERLYCTEIMINTHR